MATDNRPAGDLGALVLEKKPGTSFATLLIVLGGLILAFSLLMLFVRKPGEPMMDRKSITGAAVVMVIGAIPLALGLSMKGRARANSVALHEFGLTTPRGGGLTVPYSDLEQMTFSATRFFNHDHYMGTHDRMTLTAPAFGPKPVSLHIRRKEAGLRRRGDSGDTGPMARAAERISAIMAGRMTERLRRGETIAWTPRMKITTTGIQTTPAGFLDRDLRRITARGEGKPGDWTPVPWEKIRAADLQDGTFRLWVHGESSPRVQLPMEAPNLHPGLYIVRQVLDQGSRVLLAR